MLAGAEVGAASPSAPAVLVVDLAACLVVGEEAVEDSLAAGIHSSRKLLGAERNDAGEQASGRLCMTKRAWHGAISTGMRAFV